MNHSIYSSPDLTTFTGLNQHGLTATGLQLSDQRAVILCEVATPDPWCKNCGTRGTPRDTVVRRISHVPFGWRPTILVIRHRRYRWPHCLHVWREDLSKAVAPRQKISRPALH